MRTAFDDVADQQTDEELIRTCREGKDPQAWSELIRRYQRLIYSVAYRLCPNSEDCDDVFQRVCIEFYQSLDKIRDDRTVPAWLITVTRRMSYAVLRKRQPTVSIDELEFASAESVRAIEEEFAVEQAVAGLPDRCRRLIEMLYFDEEEPTYDDISRQMGMPVSSIGPTRARCLDKLKKKLES